MLTELVKKREVAKVKEKVLDGEVFQRQIEEFFSFGIYNPKVRKNNLNKSFSFEETNKQKQRLSILEKVRKSIIKNLNPILKNIKASYL